MELSNFGMQGGLNSDSWWGRIGNAATQLNSNPQWQSVTSSNPQQQQLAQFLSQLTPQQKDFIRRKGSEAAKKMAESKEGLVPVTPPPQQPQQQQQKGLLGGNNQMPLNSLLGDNGTMGQGGFGDMFGGGGGAMGGGGVDSLMVPDSMMTYGGSGGGAGGGGWMASAGPWAALAAAIIGNESYARNHGARDEDDWEYAKDLIGGKVFEQDVHDRWADKLPGPFEDDMRGASNLMTLDFSNAWGDFRNGTLQPLFDLF